MIEINFGHKPQEEEGIASIEQIEVKRPRRYKVLLHNDDYTTMDFVVYVLQTIFSKHLSEAQEIMLKIHNQGVGICGVFTREIAESKATKVGMIAKSEKFPLKCSIEPE